MAVEREKPSSGSTEASRQQTGNILGGNAARELGAMHGNQLRRKRVRTRGGRIVGEEHIGSEIPLSARKADAKVSKSWEKVDPLFEDDHVIQGRIAGIENNFSVAEPAREVNLTLSPVEELQETDQEAAARYEKAATFYTQLFNYKTKEGCTQVNWYQPTIAGARREFFMGLAIRTSLDSETHEGVVIFRNGLSVVVVPENPDNPRIFTEQLESTSQQRMIDYVDWQDPLDTDSHQPKDTCVATVMRTLQQKGMRIKYRSDRLEERGEVMDAILRGLETVDTLEAKKKAQMADAAEDRQATSFMEELAVTSRDPESFLHFGLKHAPGAITDGMRAAYAEQQAKQAGRAADETQKALEVLDRKAETFMRARELISDPDAQSISAKLMRVNEEISQESEVFGLLFTTYDETGQPLGLAITKNRIYTIELADTSAEGVANFQDGLQYDVNIQQTDAQYSHPVFGPLTATDLHVYNVSKSLGGKLQLSSDRTEHEDKLVPLLNEFIETVTARREERLATEPQPIDEVLPDESPIPVAQPVLETEQQPAPVHSTVHDVLMERLRDRLAAGAPKEVRAAFDEIMAELYLSRSNRAADRYLNLGNSLAQIKKKKHDQLVSEKLPLSQAEDHEEQVKFLGIAARVAQDAEAQIPDREDVAEYHGVEVIDLMKKDIGEFRGKRAKELTELEQLGLGTTIKIPVTGHEGSDEQEYAKLGFGIREIDKSGNIKFYMAVPEGDLCHLVVLEPLGSGADNQENYEFEKSINKTVFRKNFAPGSSLVIPGWTIGKNEKLMDALRRQAPKLSAFLTIPHYDTGAETGNYAITRFDAVVSDAKKARSHGLEAAIVKDLQGVNMIDIDELQIYGQNQSPQE